MGWFWSDKAKCPVDHAKIKSLDACPVDHKSLKNSGVCPVAPKANACPVAPKASSQAACPVAPRKGMQGDDELNPLNNMPYLSSEKAPGQKITLSTERVISSIPKGKSSDQGSWEYPSPQQMLNAMLRKGKGEDIDEEAVTSMVDVHNFLNEGAWDQILEWEVKHTKETKVEPRLLRFTGRPDDMSPRAQIYMWLGGIFPEHFNTQPPFDRHDWTILRSKGREKGWDEVRYVIDYYGAPDDEVTGMPSFMLDTRPALDSIGSAVDRLEHWGGPLWRKAMGDSEQ